MVDATIKESSNSVGYVGFSFLLHCSLAALLVLAPSLRPLPPGTVEMTEIAVISEPSPLGNTPEPVITELPPAPAPAAAEIVKKELAPSEPVVAVAKTPTKEVAPVKAKAPPAPPAVLPAKESMPEPVQESEEAPVVAATPVEIPEETPSKPVTQSAEESAAYQEFQKAESAIDEEKTSTAVEPLVGSADEPSANSEESDDEKVTEAAVVAAAGKENRPETLEPAGGINGIPEGARLNTDLRQHPGNVPPVYPAVARQSGWEGTVDLSYNVSPDGRVENIQITKSSGYQILDREAYRAISRYRYLPGQQGQTYHPVIFRLTGPAQALPSRLRTSGASMR